MVKRVLLFKIKEGASEAEIAQLLDVLSTYPAKLPGVKNWSLGKNFSRETSFDYALVCDFESQPDLDAYMTHPYHRETAAQYYTPIVERSASIFYEYEAGSSSLGATSQRKPASPAHA